MKEEYITLKQLSEEFGVDRSNLRKYIINLGFTPIKVRSKNNHQLVSALNISEAESVREKRKEEGYLRNQTIQNGDGYFYIIQPIPEFAPQRIKLGFTTNINGRISTYKTISPNAKLIKAYNCKPTWELAAIASITKNNCELILNEVYETNNLEELIKNADTFFEIMPKF